MLDRFLHLRQANAHRLQGFPPPQRSSRSRSSLGCGQHSGAGAEPGTAPARPPQPGLLCLPPRLRSQELPRCLPFPARRLKPGKRGTGHERQGRRRTRLRSAMDRYERRVLHPSNPARRTPPPPSPHRHRTPESRSQPVVIAIQEAVQDAGEILRPQFLLFFDLPWRPGETARQRRSG